MLLPAIPVFGKVLLLCLNSKVKVVVHDVYRYFGEPVEIMGLILISAGLKVFNLAEVLPSGRGSCIGMGETAPHNKNLASHLIE